MSIDSSRPASTPPWMIAIGWILTLLSAAALIMSGAMKWMNVKPPDGSPDIGWSVSYVPFLAIVELMSVFLYLFPRTAVLGAIVLTGYLGGAVATHVRIGDFEHFYIPIILGVVLWLGLLFRDARVRALVPIRSYPLENAGAVGFVGIGKLIGFALLGLVVAVAGLVAVILIVAMLQPEDYQISRTITIDAPPDRVFPQANDFKNWEKWSPWLKGDPAAKVTISDPSAGKGATYQWAGDVVGEGKMTIVESVANERLRVDLHFLKPFEATAETDFTFKAEGDKTVATWSMSGKRNLQGKVVHMFRNMDKMIGEKYDEGLADMKKVVEQENKK